VVWKKTGINPYTLGRADNTHGYVGMLLRVTMAVIAFLIVARLVAPQINAYLTPITWLEIPALAWVGIVLLIISLFWVILAQAQMGTAWRIGIDKHHETPLMQDGLFRISRNPIFLGMRVTLLGLFLILPTAVTLAVLVVGRCSCKSRCALRKSFSRKQMVSSTRSIVRELRAGYRQI
jgi:steroid 5-alpha reductase family enzyme